MGSTGNPQTWAPYASIRDCSQGFCSIYCPQWCYVVFPPPPPFPIQSSDSSVGANFSPFVVAIIGILASAFLLVSYYAFASKYCGNFDSPGRRSPGHSGEEPEGSQSPAGEHEAWQDGSTGLDEALIKSITVCKYKKGDGIVEITDCSVCLSEFQENENLRLLPKCSHAFHVSCIDTWLKCHTNCPLCRAHIVPTGPLLLQSPPPATPPDPRPENRQTNDHTCVRIEELEEISLPKPAVEDDGVHLRGRDSVIEIAGEGVRPVRSSSIDPSYRSRVSVAHVLEMNLEEDDYHLKDQQLSGGEGSSKRGEGENSRGTDDKGRVLNSVSTMRSTSSGQLFYTMRHGRVA